MLESLLYSCTFCSLIFWIVFSFVFNLNVNFLNVVVCIWLFLIPLFFKCVYVEFVVLYLYVLDLFLVVLILQLIASAVLICKSLWIKASAKWLNINIYFFYKEINIIWYQWYWASVIKKVIKQIWKYVVCTLIWRFNVKLLQYKSIFKNFNVRRDFRIICD